MSSWESAATPALRNHCQLTGWCICLQCNVTQKAVKFSHNVWKELVTNQQEHILCLKTIWSQDFPPARLQLHRAAVHLCSLETRLECMTGNKGRWNQKMEQQHINWPWVAWLRSRWQVWTLWCKHLSFWTILCVCEGISATERWKHRRP